MINQFVNNVMWGELDFLIIDTPPGTSDEHLAIVEALASHKQTQAIIVTTPQVLAVQCLYDYI
jgi:Mrp family chromosome partitioning ATPase